MKSDSSQFALANTLPPPAEWASTEGPYRSLFENAGVGIFQCNALGGFAHVNPRMAHLFGYDDPAEMLQAVDDPWQQLYADPAARNALLQHTVESGDCTDRLRVIESEAVRRDGSRFWVSETIRVVCDANGSVQGFEGTVIDITERRQAEAFVQWQATHDALTALPNRTCFQAHLERELRALGQAAETGAPSRCVAVLLCDLDRFKQVNDTLGHGAGDQLLREASQRLRACLPQDGVLARMGGDEFTVLLPCANARAAAPAAEAAAEALLAALSPPFLIEGHELFVSASLGVVLAPRDGCDPETLLKHADIALYRAKAAGRSRFEMFAAASAESALDAGDRRALESSLRFAVERGQLALLYQPQIDLTTGRTVGVEALLRWNHPTLGELSPDRFLPLAEETGLIVPMGEWALREACRQCEAWRQAGQTLPVSVNLTVREFAHPQVVSRVRAALEESGLPPYLLTLELTESAVRESGCRAPDVLRALKQCGVGLIIADFGNGLVPLAQLRSMPTDGVKLSRALVESLPGTGQDRAIIRALIDLAHALRQRTIAVVVEREEQRTCLLALGCDEMQGYLHSRPVPPHALMDLLSGSGGRPQTIRLSPYSAA
jgi:PAS domain S-box/diguanylate cyclase (GGDEF) domain